jgi:hypothetical protein
LVQVSAEDPDDNATNASIMAAISILARSNRPIWSTLSKTARAPARVRRQSYGIAPLAQDRKSPAILHPWQTPWTRAGSPIDLCVVDGLRTGLSRAWDTAPAAGNAELKLRFDRHQTQPYENIICDALTWGD